MRQLGFTTVESNPIEVAARATALTGHAIELTILMPCLNEAATLEGCIRQAQQFLQDNGVQGEVLIADNASDDGSPALAKRLGARVVSVPIRGYGAAIRAGSLAARGRFIAVGDADGSYDFSSLGPFLERLRAGFDLVLGNRFQGGIEAGAMPWKNRYLGNPVLSGIGRLLFGCPVGDFHCGLRAYSKEAFYRMNLQTTGMELASEMPIRAVLFGMRVAEVATKLYPDGRTRSPHLRPWRDGWRHLKYMIRARLQNRRDRELLTPQRETVGFESSHALWFFVAVVLIGVISAAAGCTAQTSTAELEQATGSPSTPAETNTSETARTSPDIGKQHELSYNVGRVISGEPMSHVFKFRNPISDLIRIASPEDIVRNCGCTTLTISPQELKSGEIAEISLVVDSVGREGALVQGGTIKWTSSNGEKVALAVSLGAVIEPALSANPRYLTFTPEEIRGGEAKTVRFTSRFNVDWDSVIVTSTSYDLQVTPAKGDDGIECQVKCVPSSSDTWIQGGVTAFGNMRTKTGGTVRMASLNVPVHCQQSLPFVAHPKLVAPQFDESGAARVRLLVKGSELSGTGGIIKSVTVRGCEAQFTVQRAGSSIVVLDISLQRQPSDTESRVLGPLLIRTATDREVEVVLVGGGT